MSGIKINPVLEAFKGWNLDTTQIRESAALPVTMKTYIDFINSYIGAPVKYVSNGPGRDQIVHI
jgi:adenylosuccinate synthase